MCRPAPGPRCSDHSLTKLSTAISKADWVKGRLSELDEEYKTLKPESRSAGKNRRIYNLTKERAERLEENRDKAVIEYNATPAGQRDLDERLQAPELTEEEKYRLEVDKAVAQARREWQANTMAVLKKAQAEGGVIKAIFLAQTELDSKNAKIELLTQQILNKTHEYDDLKNFAKSPQGKVRTRASQTAFAIGKIHRRIYKIRSNRLLMALIRDDLDRYIARKAFNLGKKTFMGGTKAAVHGATHVLVR
jgi:DNA-binding PadR family transcriptional regulator